MARRGALAQQLNAIESLASVDAICLDKTGHADRRAHPGRVDRPRRRRRRGRARARARTLRRELADPERDARRDRRALHRRRRGAAGGGAVLVAPALERACSSARRRTCSARPSSSRSASLQAVAERGGARGPARRRVRHRRAAASTTTRRRRSAQLLGLVVLGERLRARRARDGRVPPRRRASQSTVLSGDRPETVAAVAADAGIDVGAPVDGRDLPRDAGALRRLVDEHARDRPDLAGGQEARRRGARRATAATSRWSATASTTCPR